MIWSKLLQFFSPKMLPFLDFKIRIPAQRRKPSWRQRGNGEEKKGQ